MVERTKSAGPLGPGTRRAPQRSASSSVATRGGPRFPKNTSRSLSPKPRFPTNPSRAPASPRKVPASPKKKRSENSRLAAKESLLDSTSQLEISDELNVDPGYPGPPPQSPKSPLRRAKSRPELLAKKPGVALRSSTEGSTYQTPAVPIQEEGTKPKSPTRKGRTMGANRSTSKMPAITPLNEPPAAKATTKSPRSRKDTVAGGNNNRSNSKLPTLNLDDKSGKSLDEDDTIISMPLHQKTSLGRLKIKPAKSLDEDDTIISMPMEQETTTKAQEEAIKNDHWTDIPPPRPSQPEKELLSSKPKDLPPSTGPGNAKAKSPKKASKESVNGKNNKSTSKFPQLAPLVEAGEDQEKKGEMNNNSLPDAFALDAWLDGEKKDAKTATTSTFNKSAPAGKLLTADDSSWDPFDTKIQDPFETQNSTAEDPLDTSAKRPQATTSSTTENLDAPKKAGESKGIPPKQRSRGTRRSGGGKIDKPDRINRSLSGNELTRTNSPKQPLRRANSHHGLERGQKPQSAARKPSIAPRHNKPIPKGKAGLADESLLNHSLISHTSDDVSLSLSDVNNSSAANLGTSTASSSVPNHQRRTRGDHFEDNRRGDSSTLQESVSSRRSVPSKKSGKRSSVSGRKGRSSVPSRDGPTASKQNNSGDEKERRKLRKTRSTPEGLLVRPKTKSGSPDRQNNKRGNSRAKDGEEKRSGSGDRDRRRSSGSTRRARSRPRSDDESPARNITGEVEVKEILKRAHGDRSTSRPPSRPRGSSGGESFPRNAARSVSPSGGRGRGASPAPGSRHRRTVGNNRSRARSASPSSKHRRTAPTSSSRHQRSLSPSRIGTGRRNSPSQREPRGTPNSSQRDLRRPRGEKELSAKNPESGAQQPRQGMSLANVFGLERNQDGGGSDSSASHQSEALKTVVQFDPTNADSVSSFKPSKDDPNLNSSGVFKMENLKPKEEVDEGGSYLPGSMAVGSQPKGQTSSPQRGGRSRSRTSRAGRPPSRSTSRSKRRPRDGSRVRGRDMGEEGNESLGMENVFDLSNKSESFMDDSSKQQHRDSISSHGSAASFGSTNQGDHIARRRRLRQRLRQKEQKRQAATRSDEDDSVEASAYLPTNMAAPKKAGPLPSSDNDGSSEELIVDSDDDDGEDEERRGSTLSYVKKKLQIQKNSMKNELNVLKDMVTSSKSESKSVGKRLKGLFKSKDKSKKHAQLLEGGGSDSDD